MKSSIILTGATGNTGQVIAERLRERGVPFAALARSEKNRNKLASSGISPIEGDFDEPASLTRALKGFETAYLVCTPDHLLVPRELAFIKAAKDAGVRRIVKCSAYLAAVDSESQNLRSHGIIERALAQSGLSYTILRPHGFMQTFTLFSWDLVQRAGVVSFPAGDGAMPLVDLRDVAAAAVKVLLEPGHEGRAYDITGPEALRFDQIARIMERVLERPVRYVPGNEHAFGVTAILLGVTPTPREHVMKIARMVRQHRVERVHPTLQELGIRPTTYEEFLRDFVSGKTSSGNSFELPNTRVVKVINAVMPIAMRLAIRFRGT